MTDLSRLRAKLAALRAKTVENGCTEAEALAAVEKAAELMDEGRHMNSNAILHVAKKQLGLTDEDYRAVLHRMTGKSSSRDMTPRERQTVLDEFKRQGFEVVSKRDDLPPRERVGRARGALDLNGPYVPKIRALWISAYHLGVIRDRTDEALAAFARRQTGIDHLDWVRDPKDAAKVIEALKSMMTRDAGVEWPAERGALPYASQRAIIAAQLRILGLPANSGAAIANLPAYIDDLGAQIRKVKS